MKHKIKEWSRRYLPAELVSMAVTLISAWIIHQQGGGRVLLALVSTWAGNLGYYGYLFTADLKKSIRLHQAQGKSYTIKSAGHNLRGLFVEFGVAEVLDSLLIRPLVMYYIPLWIPGFTGGIILAKLTADIFFYIPAIAGYELNKKYFTNKV